MPVKGSESVCDTGTEQLTSGLSLPNPTGSRNIRHQSPQHLICGRYGPTYQECQLGYGRRDSYSCREPKTQCADLE